MNVEVNVKDRVLKPVPEVFTAMVDPAKLAGYFVSRSSGPLVSGSTLEWHFDEFGITLPVHVVEVEENRRIVFDWEASGRKARVTIRLEGRDDATTLVSINETGFPLDEAGVRQALQQTQGWTDFLCSMKAFLQHGVNLRLGRGVGDY